MAIYVGNTLISEASADGISLGTADASEVYVGTTLVWSRAADADGTAEYQNQSTTITGGAVSGTLDVNVSAYSPNTDNYANSTSVTQSQTYQIRTDYNDYIHTIVDMCTELTAPIGNGVPGVCVNPTNDIGDTNSYTQNVSRASTFGSVLTRYRTVNGTGGPIFYSGDATFSGSCSSVGTNSVTASGASIQALSISPSSFALQSSARTETITFTYRPANLYFNSGTTFSGSVNVTVPASLPAFGDAQWTGVVNVSASGNPTATAGNGFPVTMLTGGFGTVTSDTSRDVTVQVTIPSGYAGFGTTTNITRTVTQPATVSTSTVTFVIVDNISGATVGGVSPKTGNVGDAFSLTATAMGESGHSFDSIGNASTSITPSGLGAGTPTINTTFNTWSRLITGSYPANDTTYTITISGTCPADIPNTISVGNSSLTFVPGGGSGQAVTVTTGPTAGAGFSVSDNRSWISTTISGNNVNVFCTSNTGQFDTFRSGTVTVSHNDGGASATIQVEQDALDGPL